MLPILEAPGMLLILGAPWMDAEGHWIDGFNSWRSQKECFNIKANKATQKGMYGNIWFLLALPANTTQHYCNVVNCQQAFT